jgi:putative tryptophan/tyrosine transport system substrate-binding protein
VGCAEVTAKRLGLLRELLPKAARIGVLVNPTNVEIAERTVKDLNAAADPLGLKIQVLNASNGNELDAGADGLLVGPDAFFVSRRVQIAILAARHMMPAIYTISDYADAGGLISYGTDVADFALARCLRWADSQGNQANGPASSTIDEI